MENEWIHTRVSLRIVAVKAVIFSEGSEAALVVTKGMSAVSAHWDSAV